MKEQLLISACLLGRNCKYSGGNNYHPLTEKLRQLRHTAKLCRNIETHSVEMEQRLLAAQEEDRQRQEWEEKQQERKTKDGPRR